MLLAAKATLDATDLFVRGVQRVVVLSDGGSGNILDATFDRCSFGLVSTGGLDTWTLEGVDNGGEVPTWSKTTLGVPRPGVQ